MNIPTQGESAHNHRDMESGVPLIHDEVGLVTLIRALGAPAADATLNGTVTPALPVTELNGSWYLQILSSTAQVRGVLRIEAVETPALLRASGDIYVAPLALGVGEAAPPPTNPLVIGECWYPQFPYGEYAWYMRSQVVVYREGVLTVSFERHVWRNPRPERPADGEFLAPESLGGALVLQCPASSANTVPTGMPITTATIQLQGTLTVGGESYSVIATKTSPFYRGCEIEVDVMTGRTYPSNARRPDGTLLDFTDVYRQAAGFDIRLVVDREDLPEVFDITDVELNAALATERRPAANHSGWRLWIMIASRYTTDAQGGRPLGKMFDESPPYREGVASFADQRLGSSPHLAPEARDQAMGNVESAHLRTLLHEVGHAFNLYHPKADVHPVPIGTTLMNQTGDVIDKTPSGTTYPSSITFAFDEHQRVSLIHSPDPQVAPGWKRFGWGHGSLSSGVSEPTDALALSQMKVVDTGLRLDIFLPQTVARGAFVAAHFTLTNVSDQPRDVAASMELSSGDLRLLVTAPGGEPEDVRDVIVACGIPDGTRRLNPGDSMEAVGQVFYTNLGYTFRQTGRYLVSAEFFPGGEGSSVVRSAVAAVVVRAPQDHREEEIAELTMGRVNGEKVGRAFAFGDFGTDDAARTLLETLASRFADTETGCAAALTLANALSRPLRDLHQTAATDADTAESTSAPAVLRAAEQDVARGHFASAADFLEDAPERLVALSFAVAAPTEWTAPVLQLAEEHLTAYAKSSTANSGNLMSVTSDAGDTADTGEASDAVEGTVVLRETPQAAMAFFKRLRGR